MLFDPEDVSVCDAGSATISVSSQSSLTFPPPVISDVNPVNDADLFTKFLNPKIPESFKSPAMLLWAAGFSTITDKRFPFSCVDL